MSALRAARTGQESATGTISIAELTASGIRTHCRMRHLGARYAKWCLPARILPQGLRLRVTRITREYFGVHLDFRELARNANRRGLAAQDASTLTGEIRERIALRRTA